jgi:hypothetical protein
MRVLLAIVALMMPAAVSAAAGEDPRVTVQDMANGTYRVSARFTVAAPAAVARAVLTDYAGIPRFLPDVRSSRIVERTEGRALVEQEAVSKFMFFSKRVHLVLDVEEGADVIRFRDQCGKSFALYEGSWTIVAQGSGVELAYELTAQPTFDVPLFVIRKVLSADAREMAERLRAEMVARSAITS